jgi:elongator complex protein 1
MKGDMDSLQLHQQQQQQQQLGAAAGHSNGYHAASSATHSNSQAAAANGAGPVGHSSGSSEQGSVDVVASGFCETLAVLLSDGQLVFFRAVESDLWEETLEDQIALGGPKEYLIPVGLSPAAAAAAAAGSSGSSTDKMLLNDAEYYGGLSMPSGPWSRHYGSAITAVSAQGGDVQRLQFPPLGSGLDAAGSSSSSSSSSSPAIPLAEGRTVLGLVWLSQQRLLLLAAPLEELFEEGEGTVLIEASVTLPASPNDAANCSSPQQQVAPGTESVCVSYAGGRVLTAASHPAGGAMLQLQAGQLLYYPPSSSSSVQQQLLPLPAAASFPCGCPTFLLLPHAPLLNGAAHSAAPASSSSSSSSRARQAAVRVAAAAPAVGLSAAGVLYWGDKVVAADVVSVAVRGGGPGGPALLYITRQSVLYVVMIAQLPTYKHTLVSAH